MQGQALLQAEGMETSEWGTLVPDTACRWITPTTLQPMRSPPGCLHVLRTVHPLAPRHALTRELWRALLSHARDWMMKPGARYPPGPVLEQLTAPTPRLRYALHRASARTDQLTDKVLYLALEPLRIL